MRAWQLVDGFGLDHLKLSDLALAPLAEHQVRVKIHAASLNYRDLMVIRGQYNPKLLLPITPLSDGAGEVVEVGPLVTEVKVGDRVCATFSQCWPFGAPTKSTYQNTLGCPLNGMLATEGVFHEQGLVKFPDHLDFIEAATLPCAALTAFNALMCQSELKPNDTVLLQGTGGVSLFAFQFAKALELKIIITSSSSEKLERLKTLGESHHINYNDTPKWSEEALRLTEGLGVDAVIEVGGAKTLGQSIASVKKAGVICLIGVLSGALEPIDLRPVLMNNVRIQGIFVGSKASFIAMNRVISHQKIKPIIDKVFDFSEAFKAFSYLESAQHFGKICIQIH